jgi:hypothetical protein
MIPGTTGKQDPINGDFIVCHIATAAIPATVRRIYSIGLFHLPASRKKPFRRTKRLYKKYYTSTLSVTK